MIYFDIQVASVDPATIFSDLHLCFVSMHTAHWPNKMPEKHPVFNQTVSNNKEASGRADDANAHVQRAAV